MAGSPHVDALPEETLDRLVRLAARSLGAPMVLLSLAQHGRCIRRSAVGLPEDFTAERMPPPARSVCGRVIAAGAPLAITDARTDALVCSGELELPSGALACLADVVVGADGSVLGALEVLDVAPRRWTEADAATLADVAALAREQIDRDVGDPRRTTEALRESELRYRQLVEQAPEAIFVFDVDQGRWIEANAAAERLFGLSRAELLRHAPADLSPPTQPDGRRSADVAREAIAAALEGEVPVFEWVHVTAGGELRLCEIRLARHPPPSRRLVRGTVVDISARKRAERSRDRLAAIIEATTDLVGMADAELRVTYMNRGGRSMLGLAPDADVRGMLPTAFHPPWAARLLADVAVPAAVRDGSWSGETVVLDSGGREIPVSQVILAHRGLDGRPEFFATVIRDLSVRKRLEQQLVQSRKMEAVGTLAGGIAHDFNNLLTAVLGHCEVLLAEGGLPDAAREDVREIRGAGERAAALTAQLLAFSRRQVLQPQPLDLGAVVAELGPMLRGLVPADVRFEIATESGLPPAVADPVQLTQVLINLVVNAGDATPAGGLIRVETATVEFAPPLGADPEAPPGGRYAAVAVRDTGSGIDPAVLERIFEPFFTTKEPGRGSGLGLSTALGIVRQSGGDIDVVSEPGGGSRFRVLLPLAEGVADLAPRPARASWHELHGRETVLVVEDEPTVRNVIERLLTRHGYRVLMARHGGEALAMWAAVADQVDVLITDVIMPEMGGRELVERLRRLRPELRVLFVSGYDERAAAAEAPPNALFVMKPFDSRELLAALREVLER